MTQELSGFYEALADYYHLIFEDWDSSIYRQAKVLDFLISRELPGRPLNILDCACGIGTQALAFALLGHHVVASDLSAAMQEPAFFGSEGTRRIVHQVWDWTEPAKYKLHLYITLQADRSWKTHHFISEYRCLQRQELSDVLGSTGFHEPIWLMPTESGYYQPLVLARRR